MKKPISPNKEVRELKARLAEAEDLLSAIKAGSVDAVVTDDHRVFTLKGADYGYRVLFETIIEGAATLSFDGTIMYCNRQLAKMLGSSPEKIIGSSILDSVRPAERAKFEKLLTVSKTKTMRAEFRLKKRSGKLIPVLVSSSSLELETKGLCVVITDLSEQKKIENELRKYRTHLEGLVKKRTKKLAASEKRLIAVNEELAAANEELSAINEELSSTNEELRVETDERMRSEKTLRESEERMRQALQVSHSFTFEWHPETDRVVRSGSCESILKLSGEEATHDTGDNYFRRIHPSDRAAFVKMLKAMTPAASSYTVEYRVVLGDGSVAVLEEYGRASFDGTGRLDRLVGVTTDITERKRLEEELKKYSETLEERVHLRSKELVVERQRLFNVLETLPVYVILLDKDHRVPFANKFFRDRFGESRGKRCYEYLFNKTAECENCETYKVMKTKAPHHWEWAGPDGRNYDIYDFPFKDTDGTEMIMEMGIDITEQKCAVNELVDTKIELERASRLSDIGVLAATVAHELRNPLAAIQIAAHNIKRKTKDPNLNKYLANIEKKVGESDQIINNLLFYSRLKPPRYESIKIFDMIEECADALKRHEHKEVKVIRKLEPIKDIVIEADPVQIREVFNNILNNAHDAAPVENGEIRIITENDGEFIRVAIEDNGSGIASDIIDKIFDPFFTTKAKGTGLGLSVCRQIISMHEGEIGVKHGFTNGTSIIVRLPKKERKKERINSL